MTDSLMEYVKDKSFDMGGEGNELIVLYEKMIQRMNHRFNPIKYALITISCSRQHQNIEDSIKFLEEAKERMKGKVDASFLLEISQADKKLALGNHHDCIEDLSNIRDRIERLADVDPKVFSALASVFGLYYKRKEDHENYYKS